MANHKFVEHAINAPGYEFRSSLPIDIVLIENTWYAYSYDYDRYVSSKDIKELIPLMIRDLNSFVENKSLKEIVEFENRQKEGFPFDEEKFDFETSKILTFVTKHDGSMLISKFSSEFGKPHLNHEGCAWGKANIILDLNLRRNKLTVRISFDPLSMSGVLDLSDLNTEEEIDSLIQKIKDPKLFLE